VDIRPKVAAAFKAASGLGGDIPESAALKKAFTLDSTRKMYVLKRDAEGYDELLLGRALAAAGYSGVASFSLSDFSARYPYFIDSLESGMQAAVLGKQARGFERLRSVAIDDAALTSLQIGDLVFGTNVLNLALWKEIQDTNKPNPIQKVLLYSVDNALVEGSGAIAFQLSLRLVDVVKAGQILWSGSRALSSTSFPAAQIPTVGNVGLSVRVELMGAPRDGILRALRDAGFKTGDRAVLLKIDDIPVFGTYPVTREDYLVERTLEGYFSTMRTKYSARMV